jgi:hypothetical protein
MLQLETRCESLSSQVTRLETDNIALKDFNSSVTLDAHTLEQELQLEKSSRASIQKLLDEKCSEIKELKLILKAWEAMRMGKDAQIASLIERGKRHEEDGYC